MAIPDAFFSAAAWSSRKVSKFSTTAWLQVGEVVKRSSIIVFGALVLKGADYNGSKIIKHGVINLSPRYNGLFLR